MSSHKRLCTTTQGGDWQIDSDDSSEFSDDSESNESRNDPQLHGDATPMKTTHHMYTGSVRNSAVKSCQSMSVCATPNAKRSGMVSQSQFEESCSQMQQTGNNELCQLDLVAEALADVSRKRNPPPSDRRRRRGVSCLPGVFMLNLKSLSSK